MSSFDLRIVPDNGVLGQIDDAAVQKTVAGKVESIDLDLGFLPDMNETDVAIWHHGLDLEIAVGRHQHQQRLRRRDDTSDGMNGELLDDPVHRRRQELQLGSLRRLDHVLAKAGRLALCFSQVAVQRALEFSLRLRLGPDQRGYGGLRLVGAALLDLQLLLRFDLRLQDLEIVHLRTGFVRVEFLTNRDPLLKDGKHGFEFVGRCGRGSELGLLLCFLAIEDLQLGMLLFELPDQELPLNGDLRGAGAWRRLEAAAGDRHPRSGPP